MRRNSCPAVLACDRLFGARSAGLRYPHLSPPPLRLGQRSIPVTGW